MAAGTQIQHGPYARHSQGRCCHGAAPCVFPASSAQQSNLQQLLHNPAPVVSQPSKSPHPAQQSNLHSCCIILQPSFHSPPTALTPEAHLRISSQPRFTQNRISHLDSPNRVHKGCFLFCYYSNTRSSVI